MIQILFRILVLADILFQEEPHEKGAPGFLAAKANLTEG
jgi:hypothetical protein